MVEPGGLAGHLDGFVRAVREAGVPVGISRGRRRGRGAHRRRPARPRAAAARPGRGAAQAAGPPADVRRAVRPVVAARRTGRRPPTATTADDADGEPGESTARRARPDDADLSSCCAPSCCGCCSTATRRRCAGSPGMAVDRLGRGQPSPSGAVVRSATGCCGRSRRTPWSPQLLAGLLAERRPRRAGRAGGPADGAGADRGVPGARSRPRCAGGSPRRRAADQVAQNAVRPLADQVDFLRAQRGRPRRAAPRRSHPLARRLAARLPPGAGSAARAGSTSGAPCGPRSPPAASRWSPTTGRAAVHKPELVVLCDVSGSVAGFATSR